MDIKITRQKYENECGVCVLNSIYNFLYPNEKINKLDILNISNLSEKGMSLYEFKMVGQKINIDIELYELPFKELLNYENDKYFVTCLEGNRNKHFVICKKNNKSFIVYDSNGSINKYSYEEFEDIYSKIFITFKEKLFIDNKIKFLSNKKILFDFPNEYFFISIILLINLLSIFLNLIINGFIKVLIDLIIPYKFNFELIYFFLFFVNIYIFDILINYFSSLIKINKFKQLFFNNLIIYSSLLSNKKYSFFNKINREIINEYPDSIANVISVKYFEYPELISNLIHFISLIIVILFVNYWFIIPAIIIFGLNLLFGFVKFKNNKKNYHLNIYKNKLFNNHNNLITFLLNEKDQIKCDQLSQEWHNDINNYWNRYETYNNLDLITNFFETIFIKFVIISFIFICSYLIINKYNNLNLSISSLIFLLAIINKKIICSNEIFNFFICYPTYLKNKSLINDLIDLDNKNYSNVGITKNKIKNIRIKNLNFELNSKQIFKNLNLNIKNGTLIVGKNGVGKSTLVNIIGLKYGMNNSIYLDENSINQLNMKDYDNSIIYIPSESILDLSTYTNLVNNPDTLTISNSILKETKINICKNDFSKGEKQIISLLNIIDVRNKIIIFDESFSNVNENHFNLIYKKVRSYLEKDNFVIWISNNKNVKKYFKRIINLDKK